MSTLVKDACMESGTEHRPTVAHRAKESMSTLANHPCMKT